MCWIVFVSVNGCLELHLFVGVLFRLTNVQVSPSLVMFNQALSQHIANSEKKPIVILHLGKSPNPQSHILKDNVFVSHHGLLCLAYFSPAPFGCFMLFNESSVSVTPGLQSWMLLEF